MFRPSRPRFAIFLGSGPQYYHPPAEQVRGCPVPASRGLASPTPFVPDATTFLKLIGRNASRYVSKFPTWESLFSTSGAQLRELGIEPPRLRRYIMRWREKFRHGQYGIGGDLTEVVKGVAHLRIIDLPVAPRPVVDGPSLSGDAASVSPARSPARRRIVVNVAPGALLPSVPLDQVKPVIGMQVAHGKQIQGPYADPIQGTRGLVSRLAVAEGMWEDRRGHKVNGGERRRKEFLAKNKNKDGAAVDKRKGAKG
ncbi:MAG: hypothetical protein M1826_003739 [Phylliscum demangeonii]|nr:MAG: hypothetical protein M1826_003739 [Phylliscum demangeonii]